MKPLFSRESLRHAMKTAVSACVYRTGLLALSVKLKGARFASPRFLILNYHRVGQGGAPLWSGLPPRIFEAHMRYLRKHYRVVSLEQLCHELADSGHGEPAVAVTFDDGYRDTYTHAFPILRKYGIPATVYLIVESVETGNLPWYDRVFLAVDTARAKSLELDGLGSFPIPVGRAQRFALGGGIVGRLAHLPNADRKRCCSQLERLVALPKTKCANRMLDWGDVRAMRKEGISFGSHTLTHPNVGKLSSAELDEEIGGSKAIMEHRLQEPVHDFSFPFGQLSENDEAGAGMAEATVLRYLGYRSGVTSASGLNRPGANCFALRRYQMAEGAGGFCGPSLFALRVERILRQ